MSRTSRLRRTTLNTATLQEVALHRVGWSATGAVANPYLPLDTPKAIKDAMVLYYDIAKQKATNESMAENPTLKDLSGNGNDATCYNFGWRGMSGIGGYMLANLEKWIKNTHVQTDIITPNKIKITEGSSGAVGMRTSYSANINIKFRFTEILTPVSIYQNQGNIADTLIQTINEAGEYVIHLEYNHDASYNQVLISGLCTVEQLPLYPNALVSDGVDDYAAISGLPIQNLNVGYTVIAKRKTLDTIKNSCLFSKRLNGVGAGDASGAFQVERVYEGSTATYPNVCFSYGGRTDFEQFEQSDFIYQTSKSYCGHPLTMSSAPDSDTLSIFKWTAQSSGVPRGKYALYSLMLFNRDLTDEEIQWVKNNLIQ